MELGSYDTSPSQMHPNNSFNFTNTAKLPINTVKQLIAAVAQRPILWQIRHNGQKRSDITPMWLEVAQDVNLPADICRIKWGHLRDNFRKVFIRNNLSNEAPSSWRFYNDMRFMEHAVHDNIMRQTRSSSKKRISNHYLENKDVRSEKFPFNDATVPVCELNYNFDSELHRPSFSDITSFFEESSQLPNSKRVKMELNSGDDTNDGEELNDDDFDEDSVSENENEHNKCTQENGIKNAGVFTIEVLDDDEESAMPVSKKSRSFTDLPKTSIKTERIADLPFKYISVDASTNTEDNPADAQDDADRMFLISLMPFLQKVDERRKLRIRQKLQNVLIEELEFG